MKRMKQKSRYQNIYTISKVSHQKLQEWACQFKNTFFGCKWKNNVNVWKKGNFVTDLNENVYSLYKVTLACVHYFTQGLYKHD